MKRSDDPNKYAALQAALTACNQAIRGGRYHEAETHLKEAAQLGASAQVISRHAREIRTAQQSRRKPGRRAVWLGFAAAALGYLILSVQQPAGWGEDLWAALALLVVPALVGVIISRVQGAGAEPREAFFSALKAEGWAMLIYATITLLVLGSRLGRPDGGGQEFEAGAIVTIVYSLIAGAVAGAVNVMLTRIAARRAANEPAP